MFLLVASLFLLIGFCNGEQRNFTIIQPDSFALNGRPITLISSSFHYFRALPSTWKDRLLRLRALGCNALETYVPWNFHERREGHIDLSLFLNYVRLAQSLDFLILLRPGPYICAEWDWGGFPYFLATTPNIQLRTYNEPYLRHVSRWWTELFSVVRPLLVENGGPIAMVQMENEYGSYGDVSKSESDRQYLEWLIELARRTLGPNVVLYTTDSWESMTKGSLQGSAVLTLPDFGPGVNPEAVWVFQRPMNPPGLSPRMCTEYYTGWISSVGVPYANTSSADVAKWLDAILSSNASVSMYMGFGGTNFGFWNGANADSVTSVTLPQIQSYDYNAPVSESGAHNIGLDGADKFVAVQNVIAKHTRGTLPPEPAAPAVVVPKPAKADGATSLWADDGTVAKIAHYRHDGQQKPLNMENYHQAFGYIAYSVSFSSSFGPANLTLPPFQDRLSVYGNLQHITDLTFGVSGNIVSINRPVKSLSFLVENRGRVNFGPALPFQGKGMQGDVTIGSSTTKLSQNWTIQGVDLSQVHAASFGSSCKVFPCLFRIPFAGSDAADVYLDLFGWGRGSVLVNGFNLGRYDVTQKPQRTMFIPKELMNGKEDTLVIFEMMSAPNQPSVAFSPKALFQ